MRGFERQMELEREERCKWPKKGGIREVEFFLHSLAFRTSMIYPFALRVFTIGRTQRTSIHLLQPVRIDSSLPVDDCKALIHACLLDSLEESIKFPAAEVCKSKRFQVHKVAPIVLSSMPS